MSQEKFDPTDEQAKAIKTIRAWWNRRPRVQQVFYLAGYAGTGKTSLARAAVEELGLDPYRDVVFGAYTGKAALVLQQRGLDNATTIHRMIYTPVRLPDGRVRFTLNPESIVADCKLILLDECSMIDNKLAIDLLSFDKPVIVLGDPGQLPPINGAGVFVSQTPDVFLTEIHRQARGNPILRLAHQARVGDRINFGAYGDGVRKMAASDDMPFEEFAAHDQVITGKNKTRRILNTALKEHEGHTGTYPTIGGAKLICLRNQHQMGLLNGMIFNSLDECAPPKDKEQFFVQSLTDEETVFENISIYRGYFDAYERAIDDGQHQFHLQRAWKRGEPYSEFDWGYAITVHKAQGSGWRRVLLYDDDFGAWNADLRRQWLYTACTRAESELTIIAER